MPGGIRLEIDPVKWDKTSKEITCNDNNFPGAYNSYEYASKSGESTPFVLSILLHKKSVLKGILPHPISVKAISTYRTYANNILFIHIVLSSGTNWYCANPDTDVNVNENIFTRFVVEKKVLDTHDIGNILQNIDVNKGFNLLQLSASQSEIVQKLVGKSDVIFDLTKKPTESYDSEVSGTKVTVTPGSLIGGTFQKTEHTANSCSIRGIKLSGGQYMRVAGGFPNDIITNFYAYYKADYNDPLLVELNISLDVISGSYVTSRYLLSKNDETNIWDIRKIGSYIEDYELKKVLQNISENSKLDVDKLEDYQDLKSKLGDISKGVIVDLIGATEVSPDFTKSYNSDGVRIPYKTLSSSDYYVVRQPYFPSFILKKIKTGENTEVAEDKLPTLGVEIWQLNVYYKNAYRDPVLIEVICKYENSGGCTKYVYYYALDGNKWQGYLFITSVGGTNPNKVVEHFKYNGNKIVPSELGELERKLVEYPYVTLNVTVDLSKPAGNPSYTPEGDNTVPFTVRRSKVDANFYKFTQTAEDNARFKVKSVTYGKNSTLNNIKSAYSIDSLSAYYFGESPKEDKNLVLIQFGEGDSSVYYTIEGDNNWTKQSGIDKSTLKDALNKQNCKKNHAHVINLSATSGPYKCPGCNAIDITVSGPNAKSNYSWYEHTLSGNGESISGFKDERDYQTGFSSLKGYSNVKIFWYPENSGSPLLICITSDNVGHGEETSRQTHWYRLKHKGSNEWAEVKENAPFSDNDSSKILKLLKKINGESEGLSEGTIAGYTAAGVMTPLATAEAVNYTLDTGWSIIRRVMAIFNAVV